VLDGGDGRRRQRRRLAMRGGPELFYLPLLLLLFPPPSGGGHWRPEKRHGNGAAAGPLAGVRIRPRASAPPSSGLAAVPKPARQAAARVFIPRDGGGPPAKRRLWCLSSAAAADGGACRYVPLPLFFVLFPIQSVRVRVTFLFFDLHRKPIFSFDSFRFMTNPNFSRLDLPTRSALDTIVRTFRISRNRLSWYFLFYWIKQGLLNT